MKKDGTRALPNQVSDLRQTRAGRITWLSRWQWEIEEENSGANLAIFERPLRREGCSHLGLAVSGRLGDRMLAQPGRQMTQQILK